MAPHYAVSAKRVSFDRMFNHDGPHGGNYPIYRDDPNGNVLVVTKEDQGAANAEWWRAMKNPANYHLPAVPTNLRVSRESENLIVLNWTDNSDNESGFKLEKAADSKFQHELKSMGTVWPKVTTFREYDYVSRSAAITYYYRVRATNAAGDSANAVVSITLPARAAK
jgi:hypothetical protein